MVKRNSQKIFIIRETVTSYTTAEIVTNETKACVTESLIKLCNLFRPSTASQITIRLDPAPAHQSMFISLKSNSLLSQNNINLEIGRTLNKNKNPVIDKAIRELVRELLILNPMGGPTSPRELSQAIANLNSRYRKSGLSAHEMWTQRDQISGDQLPIDDRQIIINQYNSRMHNHPHSQKSKAFGKPPRPTAKVNIGSLVFVHTDRNKISARQRYIVTSIDGNNVKLRKFTKALFGVKEYEAKLQEIYTVPVIESCELPEKPTDSSSDEDYVQQQNSKSRLTPDVISDTYTNNIQSDSEPENDESNDHQELGETSEEEEDEQESPRRRTSRYSYDPVFVSPPGIRPASVEREKRITKKPERYGTWSS